MVSIGKAMSINTNVLLVNLKMLMEYQTFASLKENKVLQSKTNEIYKPTYIFFCHLWLVFHRFRSKSPDVHLTEDKNVITFLILEIEFYLLYIFCLFFNEDYKTAFIFYVEQNFIFRKKWHIGGVGVFKKFFFKK